MSKHRTIEEIQKEFNEKLHSLGHQSWQIEHLIPEQMEEIKQSLKALQKEALLVNKIARAKIATEKTSPGTTKAETAQL